MWTSRTTIPDTPNVQATELKTLTAYTPYGEPNDSSKQPHPYGWEGAGQRSDDNVGGLLQMGARTYNPATGRFLQTDPIPGGTPNPYTYPPDPVNGEDLNGQWWGEGVWNSAYHAVTHPVETYHKAVSTVRRTYNNIRSIGTKSGWSGNWVFTSYGVRLTHAQTGKLARLMEYTGNTLLGVDAARALTFQVRALQLGGKASLVLWGATAVVGGQAKLLESQAKKAHSEGGCSMFSINRVGGTPFLAARRVRC